MKKVFQLITGAGVALLVVVLYLFVLVRGNLLGWVVSG